MPVVRFAAGSVETSIECIAGANLRMILLRARLPLYHTVAKAIHCRGFGTCGTCAVRIEGAVSEPAAIERLRLALPPHARGSGLRLACQVSVLGDVRVVKHAGLFGQRVEAEPATPSGGAVDEPA